MNQEKQNAYRSDLVDTYQKNAFEYLGLYQYWGEKFKRIEKDVKEYEARIAVAETKIREIKALPDHHTVENRAKAKAQQDDINRYKKMIEQVKRPLQEIEKKCISCQEHAVDNLELAEMFSEFKVKTKEEMAADKKKNIIPATEPVVAGGESR